MTSNAKLSVAITVYNGVNYVRKAIDSILNQDFHDFELVVVNDGSTDSTSKILDAIEDDKIKALHPGRIGRAKVLNLGVENSAGEYIAILDADDAAFPHRLVK